MGKLYSLLIRFVLLLIIAFTFNQSKAISIGFHETGDTVKSKVSKITDTRPYRPEISGNFKVQFVSFKPLTLMGSNQQVPKNLQIDTSAILNVKVYPIPVADQLNVSYHLNKDSNVTIQLMSILGSKLITLLSQRMTAGEQKNSFSIAPRGLVSGPYLIRVIVGNQHLVDKRILIQ